MALFIPRLITRTLATALFVPVIAGAQETRDTQLAVSPEPRAVTFGQPVVAPVVVERAAAPEAPRAAEASGPQVSQLGVALRARANETAPAPAPLPRGDSRQSRALMIVGVAALITGAVIGGDEGTIIMLGGAGIGLYGLYQFLQ